MKLVNICRQLSIKQLATLTKRMSRLEEDDFANARKNKN